MASRFSSTKSLWANSQSPLVSGTAVTRGAEGPASEGLMLAVAVTEAVKSSSSSSEISTTPLGSAFDSGPARARAVISSVLTEVSSFPFFTTTVSSCEDATTEDGVTDRAAGDAGVGDDDAEGEDGGEALADCPGDSPSSRLGILRRQLAVFVLMTINVEMLSGSNPALRRLVIKPRPA